MLLEHFRHSYFTIPNGQKPMSEPHPGSNSRVMLYRISLGSRYILQEINKANKAIALNRHCLILAFCITFNFNTLLLKNHEML